MVFNKLIQKQSLLATLLFLGSSVYADEVNKMSIIDGQDKQIKVESFNFERLDSEDATTIKIEAKDKYGYTPLHLAADQGSFKAAQQLIKAGANVNSQSEWGSTPLHASVANNDMFLTKLLIGIEFASGAPPVFTDIYPPDSIILSKGVLSTTKSLIIGKLFACQGSTTRVSPSLNDLICT